MTRTSTGALVFVALALALASCADDAPSTTTTMMPEPEREPPVTAPGDTSTLPGDSTTNPPSDASPQSWMDFEPAFMGGCTAQNGEELCACMFQEFQDRYEFEDFFGWAYQAEDDPRITEVVDICSG